MRPLVFVVLVAIAVLLVLLIAEMTEDSVEHDSVRVVAQWGSEKPDYIVTADMFTTTTTARPRSAPTERRTMRAASAAPAIPLGHEPGSINGYPCGGPDLPSCRVMRRESGGNPTAYNPTGCGGRSCGGLFQFDPVTWIPGCTVAKWNARNCGNYMGYQYAHQAPVDVQYARTREVYANGAGCGHWRDC